VPGTGPLNVLWLGSVNLRKGIPYLIEAAHQLPDVRFTVAGPLDISKDAIASAPPNMDFLGRITRDRTAEIYRAADVFVLPTLSDGFAITQLEAMGYGLPVVTTPNCGDVVTDGVDGLIVRAGDANALAKALARLDADRNLVREMSRQAIDKIGSFRLPNQSDQIEAEVMKRRGITPSDAREPGVATTNF
jgi:glycosyltransferase involved in cell wall biosynthesis